MNLQNEELLYENPPNDTTFELETITVSPMIMQEPLVPPEIYVRPCVDGNSTTDAIFNFSLISECTDPQNCTLTNKQPGAFFLSPILMSLAGITGQICALTYLHLSQGRKNHKTVFYVMLTTLIWTDLLGKTITTPEPIITYAMGYWVGGVTICNLHGYSMSLIGIVTHLLVAIMALERIIGITNGYFYKRVITTTRVRFLLMGTWLFCIVFCLFPLFGVGEFKLHYPGTWCHLNQHLCPDDGLPTLIFQNLYATINLTCLIVMVCCNLIVVVTLLKMRMTNIKPPRLDGQKRPTHRLREREVQMVILLLIITVVFAFSWAPLDLLMFKNQLYPPPPYKNPVVDIKAIRLVSLNQIIDPWSYIISRLIFRSKLWKSCRKKLLGRMITRTDSGRSDRKSSIMSAFSINSRKNSRASPTRDQVQIEALNREDDSGSPTLIISHRKKSQVQFNVKEESTSTSQPERFVRNGTASLKLRLRKAIPNLISSILNRSKKSKDEDAKLEPISTPVVSDKNFDAGQNFLTHEYSEQISLLESNLDPKTKKALEERLAKCLSPYLAKDGRQMVNRALGISFMSLHGRSNSWCGVHKSRFGDLHRSRSLEDIRNEEKEDI